MAMSTLGRHSAPDWRFGGVFAGAEEFPAAQVLLYPFEKQFDLPAALVKRSNVQRRQEHVVGEEHQGLARVEVFEANVLVLIGVGG